MKRAGIFLFCLVSFQVYAAGIPEGVTPTVQLSNQAPEDTKNFIESAIDRAQQITTAMETLLTLNQSLQYQIQAAQALSEGSWDSFVEFFNYETAAIAGYSNTIANLETIAPFVDDEYFKGDSYKTLVAKSDNIRRSMDAANDMVRSTDYLIKQSEYNAQMIRTGIRDAANAPNALQALQGQAKILAAVAGESRASTQLLYSMQRYEQIRRNNEQQVIELKEQISRKGSEAPGPYDLNSPYERNKASDYIRESITGKYINESDSLQF
jgi:conjugal transfer/entry exclusion protein